jgi:CDP-diacylglycerol--glycerol-3-phosphate 3-phosphatidyltransferase
MVTISPLASSANRGDGRMSDPRESPLTIPNLLTLARLPLAVVLYVCMTYEAWWLGLAVFVVAAITDGLDGWLARRWDQTSAFGRSFDPLTDKVLVCGAFIFLIPVPAAGVFPWMVTVVIGRELLITGLRGYLEQQGLVFGADQLGKLKMVLQCAVLIGLLLALPLNHTWPWLDAVNQVLLWVMLAVTVLSGVQYVVKAMRLLKGPGSDTTP